MTTNDDRIEEDYTDEDDEGDTKSSQQYKSQRLNKKPSDISVQKLEV